MGECCQHREQPAQGLGGGTEGGLSGAVVQARTLGLVTPSPAQGNSLSKELVQKRDDLLFARKFHGPQVSVLWFVMAVPSGLGES